MGDPKWERVAWSGGFLFVVLTLVGAFWAGSPPKPGDSPFEIAKYFTQNSSEIRWGSFVSALAVIPLVWWYGSMFRALRWSSGSVRLSVVGAIGVAIAAGGALFNSVLMGAIAIAGVKGAGGLNEIRFFYLLATNVLALTAIGSAILVGAITSATLRAGLLPKALGWFGLLIVIVSVLGSALMASTRDVIFTFVFAGFLAFALYIVLVSVVMIRREPPAPGG